MVIKLDRMVSRNPRTLPSGANNLVIALTEREVGKIFAGDSRSDIGSEAEKMKFANSVNGLVAKFIRLDINEELASDMLVMERLYPMDFRAYEFSVRELQFEVFVDELNALHPAGFVHRDLKIPANIGGERFDNIFLTSAGIRLIDVDISALKSQVGKRLFQKYLDIEKQEVEVFEKYFLNR